MSYGNSNDYRVNGNFFEGLFRPTRSLFKKKKKYKSSTPSPSTLQGRYNLTRSPLSSNRSFYVGSPTSAKALKSKVTNGKRI